MSKGELEVTRLMARGWTHKRIAAALNLSVRQVRRRWQGAKAKAGIECKGQLIALRMLE